MRMKILKQKKEPKEKNNDLEDHKKKNYLLFHDFHLIRFCLYLIFNNSYNI